MLGGRGGGGSLAWQQAAPGADLTPLQRAVHHSAPHPSVRSLTLWGFSNLCCTDAVCHFTPAVCCLTPLCLSTATLYIQTLKSPRVMPPTLLLGVAYVPPWRRIVAISSEHGRESTCAFAIFSERIRERKGRTMCND